MHSHSGRVLAAVASSMIAFIPYPVSARDDGHYTNSPLKQWFDGLASGEGLCCSFADGVSVEDVDGKRRMAVIASGSTGNGLSYLTARQ
jgi:hypothetical protein